MALALASWNQIIVTLGILQLGWLFYGVIHRLFLSPLATIPGPKLAALTSWYEFYYDVIKPGKYIWKIQDLHVEYGEHYLLFLEIIWSDVHLTQDQLYESHHGRFILKTLNFWMKFMRRLFASGKSMTFRPELLSYPCRLEGP